MSIPTLTPASNSSKSILPATGSEGDVNKSVPYKVYSDTSSGLYDTTFLSGAANQVTYVYRKLGGDVLDIELNVASVYASYEEAVLEYSYILNIHQANNSLSSYLGHSTASFDHKGQLKSTGDTTLSSSLDGKHASLKYPKFDFGYSRRASEAAGAEIGVGRGSVEYSASVKLSNNTQDYDLQAAVLSASIYQGDSLFAGKVGKKKITVNQVFYKTPQSMWRFFGYYGGLNVVGNLHSYGQFSDNSSFEIIPAWQNKLQSMAFEDAIYTRMSHFSFELKNNKLRLFPKPYSGGPTRIWFKFSIPTDPFIGDDGDESIDGINNMNTLPFANLPYRSINAIGKQWIRRFALSLSKEVLGQIRSKFATIPIPGESVTLNGPALISEAREEQSALREELKTTLAEMTYVKLAESDSALMESTKKIQESVPLTVFVG